MDPADELATPIPGALDGRIPTLSIATSLDLD